MKNRLASQTKQKRQRDQTIKKIRNKFSNKTAGREPSAGALNEAASKEAGSQRAALNEATVITTEEAVNTAASNAADTSISTSTDINTDADADKKIGKSIRIKIRRNKKHQPDIAQLSAIPTSQLEEELAKEKVNSQSRKTLKSTLLTLATVASVAVLVATLWLPVLRIYGNSMTPTLQEGDLVVSMKQNDFATGDVIAFYYNNKILVKRVIAGPGDYVDLDEDGNVYVNGTLLDEPYLSEKAIGETDLDYPYQVPDNHWFVMGDHRSVSLDSRTKAIGTIDESQIVGKLVTRIWPLG